MNTNSIYTILAVAIFVMISSCSKKDNPQPTNTTTQNTTGNNNNNNNPCQKPSPPTLSSNSPVNYGDTIYLTASSVVNAIDYLWTLPNGSTVHQQNPFIVNATTSYSGNYTCKVTIQGNCTSDAASVLVVVNIVPPCSPTDNQIKLNSIPAINLTYIYGAVSTISGFYEITGNGSNGDIEITFGTTAKPVSGVYNIISYTSFMDSTQASVSVTSSNAYWQTSSGNLYVNVTNGKVSATFCNLSFSESTYYTTTTGSGMVTEP